MSELEKIEKIREEFPILRRQIYGKRLIYLDNAASSQTPGRVVRAIEEGYTSRKANVHRGVHCLSQEATDAMERGREEARRLINAPEAAEVIVTRGTTEGLNLVASSFGRLMNEGDEVILTVMEHHSNIVPWQLTAMHRGIKIKVAGMRPDGTLDLEEYEKLFTDRTRIVSVCHASNVLGTVNPIAEMARIAHSHGSLICVDGAQGVPHCRVDVRALDCDFYAFSSHKMYGPTGIGFLWGRRDLLETMPPYQGGGEMIGHVSFAGTTWADLPYKFEAGTPDYVDAAAFAQAVEFMDETGIEFIGAHEHALTEYATAGLLAIPGVKIYGEAPHKCGVISFNLGSHHPYDVGMLLDKMGIAVRTGHHCAQPLMEALGVPGTVRASFAVYNTMEEVDRLVEAVGRISDILG